MPKLTLNKLYSSSSSEELNRTSWDTTRIWKQVHTLYDSDRAVECWQIQSQISLTTFCFVVSSSVWITCSLFLFRELSTSSERIFPYFCNKVQSIKPTFCWRQPHLPVSVCHWIAEQNRRGQKPAVPHKPLGWVHWCPRWSEKPSHYCPLKPAAQLEAADCLCLLRCQRICNHTISDREI